MSKLNYLALLGAGVTLATGAIAAKKIEDDPTLTQVQKDAQLAALAAQDVPKVLTAFGVPAEYVALAASEQLEAGIIQAAEAAEQLVKEFAPHAPAAETPAA